MKRLLKGVVVASAGAVLLVILAYVVVVLVNLKDEELDAAAKAFAAAARRDVPPADNGYLSLWGWRAPEGDEPHAAGKAMLDQAAQGIAEGRLAQEERKDLLPPVDQGMLCNLWKPDCLQKVRADPAGVAFQLAKHETLRHRIRDAAKYPSVQSVAMPYHPLAAIPLPPYSGMWRLGATESAHAWISGRPVEALALSEGRMAIARRLLRDSPDILGMVLGTAWLRAEAILLLDILQHDPEGARPHLQAFERLLQPLAPEEIRSTRWVNGAFAERLDEYRAFGNLPAQRRMTLGPLLLGMEAMFNTDSYQKDLPWWFEATTVVVSPLFQPNASANAVLRHLSRAAQFVGNGEMGVRGLDLSKGVPGALEDGWSAYNPVGRILGLPRVEDYLLRRLDCDRLLRLVAVHAALVKARVPAEGVASFLASLPMAVDPAMGRPVGWNAGKAVLHVDALYVHGTKLEQWRVGDVEGRIGVVYRP